jgi:hypothetical protein
MSLDPETLYSKHTEHFLNAMRNVKASKRDFLEGLRSALGEIEVEIQAAKETMNDGD